MYINKSLFKLQLLVCIIDVVFPPKQNVHSHSVTPDSKEADDVSILSCYFIEYIKLMTVNLLRAPS